jgi:S-adenosyl methyltransferase
VPGPEEPAATLPHIARVYDYLLGGTDNFAADRAVGDQLIADGARGPDWRARPA